MSSQPVIYIMSFIGMVAMLGSFAGWVLRKRHREKVRNMGYEESVQQRLNRQRGGVYREMTEVDQEQGLLPPLYADRIHDRICVIPDEGTSVTDEITNRQDTIILPAPLPPVLLLSPDSTRRLSRTGSRYGFGPRAEASLPSYEDVCSQHSERPH